MAAAEYPTIPGIGSLAEMEDEGRSALASSIEGNSGGSGQKRKRDEEEEPNFLQIANSRRLVMLESVVCVLKCFNSVLRSHVPADGDLGFRLETGSVEEQRIAGLIYSHACSYILLYHLEKNKANGDPSPIVETVKHGDEAEVLPDWGKMDALLWEVAFLDHSFVKPIIDCRRASADGPTPGHRNGSRGTTSVSSMFDELREYNKGCRKQELMDVLHTLEVIGHARSYSPPKDDDEILIYKEIRKQISHYILHVHARRDALVATGEKPCNYPVLSDPFSCPSEPEALCFIPPMHQLEVSFEQMPEHLALLQECKQRVAQLLSSGLAPMSDRVRDLVVIMQSKDAALSALFRWKPRKTSFMIPRSECLDRIIDVLGRIISLGEQTPTKEEVGMYALIGEHVRSAIWMSFSIGYSERKDKRSCEVYFANVYTDHDHSSLSKLDAHGKHGCTREQLLEQIVAYMRAFKSSFLDDAPSLEEGKKYIAIWGMLYPGLLVCLNSRPIPHGDEEPEEIPESDLPLLKRRLCYIYERLLRFLEEVKKETCSAAAVVHRALRPEVQISPEAALDWFMICEDDAATKAKEFVDRSLSLGSMAHLDHALLMLADLQAVGFFFFKLSSAVTFLDWAWCDVEKYAMVASEVENALSIICSEKPHVK